MDAEVGQWGGSTAHPQPRFITAENSIWRYGGHGSRSPPEENMREQCALRLDDAPAALGPTCRWQKMYRFDPAPTLSCPLIAQPVP